MSNSKNVREWTGRKKHHGLFNRNKLRIRLELHVATDCVEFNSVNPEHDCVRYAEHRC